MSEERSILTNIEVSGNVPKHRLECIFSIKTKTEEKTEK